MIKENLQRKKLYPIKEFNDIYKSDQKKIFKKDVQEKKVNSIKEEIDDKSVIKGGFK